jgi:ribosomal protein S8E
MVNDRRHEGGRKPVWGKQQEERRRKKKRAKRQGKGKRVRQESVDVLARARTKRESQRKATSARPRSDPVLLLLVLAAGLEVGPVVEGSLSVAAVAEGEVAHSEGRILPLAEAAAEGSALSDLSFSGLVLLPASEAADAHIAAAVGDGRTGVDLPAEDGDEIVAVEGVGCGER